MPSELNPDVGQTPNVAIFVRGPVRNYPVVVVEIGVTQDASSLLNKATIYLGPDYPTVVYYIALKRYDYRRGGDQGMVVFIFNRDTGADVPVQIVSQTGTGPLAVPVWASLRRTGWAHLVVGVGVDNDPPCNGFNISRYVITLPASQIFRGLVNGAPAGAPAAYVLDLFKVQKPFTSTIGYNE